MPSQSTFDELRPVLLCGRCRKGMGGECHTPGCALWMNRAPDVPVEPDPLLAAWADFMLKNEEDSQRRRRAKEYADHFTPRSPTTEDDCGHFDVSRRPREICDPAYAITPRGLVLDARAAHNLALACGAARNRMQDQEDETCDPMNEREQLQLEWLDWGAKVLWQRPLEGSR